MTTEWARYSGRAEARKARLSTDRAGAHTRHPWYAPGHRNNIWNDLEGHADGAQDGVVRNAHAHLQVGALTREDQGVDLGVDAEIIRGAGGQRVLWAEDIGDCADDGPTVQWVDLAVANVEIGAIGSIE